MLGGEPRYQVLIGTSVLLYSGPTYGASCRLSEVQLTLRCSKTRKKRLPIQIRLDRDVRFGKYFRPHYSKLGRHFARHHATYRIRFCSLACTPHAM